MEVYGDWDFQAPDYLEPQEESELDIEKLQQEYEEKVKGLEEELDTIRKHAKEEQAELRTERKKISKNFMRRHKLTEAETRIIIDEKLRLAGWEADTTTINHQKNSALPEKKSEYGNC